MQLDSQELVRPWTMNNNLKGRPLMSQKEFVERLEEYARKDSRGALGHAAAISLIFLTASRVNEILSYSYRGNYKDKVFVKYSGICYGDIKSQVIPNLEDEDKSEEWILITRRVLKINKYISPEIISLKNSLDENEKRKFLEAKRKSLQVVYHTIKILNDGLDGRLLKIVNDYYNSFENKNKSLISKIDQKTLNSLELFNFKRSRLHYIVRKLFGFSCHHIRHLRCHTLVNHHNFSASDLKSFVKWRSNDMALSYTESNNYQLEQKLRHRNNEFE